MLASYTHYTPAAIDENAKATDNIYMHKPLVVRALGLALIASLLITPHSSAVVLSDEQIHAISTNCENIKSNVQRIRQSDKLLRVSLGQYYDNISRRLMTPLNSRIALNNLDGIELSRSSITYNSQLSAFRRAAQDYDSTLQQALSMDCRSQPIEFYNVIETARQQRLNVYNTTLQIKATLNTYKSQLTIFTNSLEKTGNS